MKCPNCGKEMVDAKTTLPWHFRCHRCILYVEAWKEPKKMVEENEKVKV